MLLNFSCASKSIKQTKTEKMISPYVVHNIELRPNQVKPIEYLMSNPEQKGLIIAHYLGTGKTFTALGFAEKNPLQEVIILAPYYLEANWKSEMRKMGIPNNKRYIFFPMIRLPRSFLIKI